MENHVNPQMVVLAREAQGWTQSELAVQLSVSQGKLSKIEAGILSISPDLLKKLARALDRPETFFQQKEPLYGIDTSILYHRKRESALVRVLRRIDAHVNIKRMHIAALMRAADIEAPKAFPVRDIEEFGGRPVKVARALRASWALPRGPMEDLTRAIEDAGGVVIHFDFGTRLIDGVSQRLPGLPPLFFLNSELPADRERMTLAHELGHIVMHQVLTPDIEEQANIFAANFLMPADDIRHSFNEMSLARIAALKPYWKVSMAALLVRARDLGKVSGNQYDYLWKQMSKAGYRMREPRHLDLPHEEPRLLRDLIEFYRKRLGYALADLCRLLHSTEHEVRSVYLGETALHVV